MTTPQIERAERPNSRSWRALGLRALTFAGFAAAAWLLSGSAAQADTGSQSDLLNVAPVTDSVSAPLGGLLDKTTDFDSVAGLAPVAQTMNTATKPVLDVTSDVLGAGSGSDRALPDTTNQVVSTLAQTTQVVLSVITEIPAEVGKTPILSPLNSVVAPVADVMRPVVEPAQWLAGYGKLAIADEMSREVTVTHGALTGPSLATSSAFGGPPAASSEATPEISSGDRDLVIAAGDVTSPVPSRKSLPSPARSGLGLGTTGSTGSLLGSQQDGGAFALAPASVTHSTPIFGVLPVTSFIGISRDSAADPMVSPD